MSDTTELRAMSEHQMIEYARRMRQERDRYRETLLTLENVCVTNDGDKGQEPFGSMLAVIQGALWGTL